MNNAQNVPLADSDLDFIFIPRDYSVNTDIRFSTEYPAELVGIVRHFCDNFVFTYSTVKIGL